MASFVLFAGSFVSDDRMILRNFMFCFVFKVDGHGMFWGLS